MAIKILYEHDEIIVEDLEEAAEIISDGNTSPLDNYVEIPLAVIDLSTGESYRYHWSVILVPQAGG